jgi:import inner membrane translocase subunit TIM13
MSWFGFGGSKSSDPAPSTSDYSSSSFSSDNHSSFSEPSFSSSASSGHSLQDQIQMEAQKVEVQQMIVQLTVLAFDKCVTKPGSSLSYSEKSCIEASVGKYIDAKVLISNKLMGGAH